MQKQIRFYGRLDSYPPYDTFDNLANRTGAYYYGSYSSDTGTYQNSRRQDWTYDADEHRRKDCPTSCALQ